jgi:hypothetical protein
MNSETALLHKFLTFANEDISVMEMEIVSKLIQIFLLHHRFVQVASTVLEIKTAYLIQYQFLLQKDEFMTVRVINMLYALLLGLW